MTDLFDNTLVGGIHKSRYVASWINKGGTFGSYSQWRKGIIINGRYAFQDWLKTLVIDGRHLTEDEIHDICTYATNGKLELETSAEAFMRNNEKS